MASPEVAEGITRDANAATLIRLRSLPMIYVNGKRIPRWRLDGRCMLPQIIDMAADPDFVP